MSETENAINNTNSVIPDGTNAETFILRCEDSNLISKKGDLFVGTGEITKTDSDGVSAYKTDALSAGADSYVVTKDSSADGMGIKYDNPIDLINAATILTEGNKKVINDVVKTDNADDIVELKDNYPGENKYVSFSIGTGNYSKTVELYPPYANYCEFLGISTLYLIITGYNDSLRPVDGKEISLGTKDLKFLNIYASGKTTGESFKATSDKRLKENIKPFECDKSILDLPICEFNFKSDEEKTKHIGCLAQDLQQICPEIVNSDSQGYLSIEEFKLIYLLIDEVKKLKERVEKLKKNKAVN